MRTGTRSTIGAALALVWLGACAAPERVATAANACPPVRSYTKDFRDRAIAELDLLPANSAVEEMLTDYAVLRQQIHGCQPQP